MGRPRQRNDLSNLFRCWPEGMGLLQEMSIMLLGNTTQRSPRILAPGKIEAESKLEASLATEEDKMALSME